LLEVEDNKIDMTEVEHVEDNLGEYGHDFMDWLGKYLYYW